MLARRIYEGVDVSGTFDKCRDTFIKYINIGSIPKNLEKSAFLEQLKLLTQDQKAFLTLEINNELPQDSWFYTGAILDNLPTAAKWGAVTGLAVGIAHYKISEKGYSAIASGFFAGFATLFSHSKYSQHQFKTIIQAKEERAREVIKYLSIETSLDPYTSKRLNSKGR